MTTPRARKPDYRYKIIVLGESNVGKTCLLHRYKEDVFKQSLMSTVGIDTVSKRIVLDGKNILLSIWDTAGQERFQSITKSYYRNADGILLVFDLSDENTFALIDRWVSRISEETEEIPLFLVGNKRDKVSDSEYRAMEVTYRNKAEKIRARFYCTSAKEGLNVNSIFEDMAMCLMREKASPKSKTSSSIYRAVGPASFRNRSNGCCG
jgi:Ras-related protein Rab-8A